MLSEMFTMAPGNKDHHVATRCAISVFAPLITLVLLDRLDLAIFASFGAFTGIYGRNEPHAKRLGLQIRAGALMRVVMLLAALTARAGVASYSRPRRPSGFRSSRPHWWPEAARWSSPGGGSAPPARCSTSLPLPR